MTNSYFIFLFSLLIIFVFNSPGLALAQSDTIQLARKSVSHVDSTEFTTTIRNDLSKYDQHIADIRGGLEKWVNEFLNNINNEVNFDSLKIQQFQNELLLNQQRINNLKTEAIRTDKLLDSIFRRGSSSSDTELPKGKNSLVDSLKNIPLVADSLLVQVQSYQSKLDSITNLDKEKDSKLSKGCFARFVPANLSTTIRKNMTSDRPSLTKFDASEWSGGLLLVIIGLSYFWNLYLINKRKFRANIDFKDKIRQPIWKMILKSIILSLVLFPLTSFVLPSFLVETSYILVFISLFILFYSQGKRDNVSAGRLIFSFYILILVANLILSEDWISRLFAIIVNVFGIYLVWKLAFKRKFVRFRKSRNRYIFSLVILGFVLATIFGSIGMIYGARVFSLASGVAFIQIISLKSVRFMLFQDLDLFYKTSDKNALIRRFDLNRLLRAMSVLTSVCFGWIVIVTAANNLDITNQLSKFLSLILLKDHNIGSVSFNYADLLLAVGVIYAATWLQNNIKSILVDPTQEDSESRGMVLFPLFRVGIILLGLLIGFRLLGLGMDKLAVILGALSVGIGLGMQNIVNNFVSGIILVFEKPFKIGDYIGIGDQKGRILEIGIRASTLKTDSGSKVVIPNGDLLSGRLINWTFSNNSIMINFVFKISGTDDIDKVKSDLQNLVLSYPEVNQSLPTQIHTVDIKADSYSISLQLSVKEVQIVEPFKSKFLEHLKTDFATKGILIESA